MRQNRQTSPEELLRQENRMMRYDAAVRRLFTAMPDGAFDARSFEADTGLTFAGEQFFAVQLEDDPRYPSAPPSNVDQLSPFQRYMALRDLVRQVLGRDQPCLLYTSP